MKKLYTKCTLGLLFVFFYTSMNLLAQCNTGALWQSNVNPVCNGSPTVAVSGQWAGEYSTFNLTAGVNYTISSSVGTDYLTVTDNATNTPIVFGTSPLVFNPGASGL